MTTVVINLSGRQLTAGQVREIEGVAGNVEQIVDAPHSGLAVDQRVREAMAQIGPMPDGKEQRTLVVVPSDRTGAMLIIDVD